MRPSNLKEEVLVHEPAVYIPFNSALSELFSRNVRQVRRLVCVPTTSGCCPADCARYIAFQALNRSQDAFPAGVFYLDIGSYLTRSDFEEDRLYGALIGLLDGVLKMRRQTYTLLALSGIAEERAAFYVKPTLRRLLSAVPVLVVLLAGMDVCLDD